ncbi:MAG: hypothetical protein VR65_06085 [Desulfobulbaceae bacterium BRH_c16a]|nr:MAG: hypothetical protein VR65_06085 [Desulfobulbaceae bacterium BRH_c16a]
MTDLDQINSRLDSIERMLLQLLKQQPQTLPPGPVSDIRTEIAQVRAAGGDLVAHFKGKAKKTMLQEKVKKNGGAGEKRNC